MKKFTGKKYIVAFVDALGTKERIERKNQKLFFKNLKNAVHEAEKYIKRLKNVGILDADIKMRTFSDNILFFLKLERDRELREKQCLGFILYINAIQSVFVESYEWLLRGFITFGGLSIDDNIIWGKALSRAYLGESTKTSTPRILLDPEFGFEFWDAFNTLGQDSSRFLVLRDIDGKPFLNYIPFQTNNHSRLKYVLEKLFIESTDIVAQQKILMLILHHNRVYSIPEFKGEKYIIDIVKLMDRKQKYLP